MSNPILIMQNAGYGETPDCPEAAFRRGDVVKVRNKKTLADFPREAVVLMAVPPGFPADYALADMINEPRPLMITKPSRAISYILANEGDPKPYLLNESNLLPSGKPPVEIGTISRGEQS